mmetsp:Transcript_4468/g.12907  ORF Transcript_4468/g.12907 Transcript_4468/m.12907 type:complete len:267 (+) Transcript_4468:93-893(+)
MSGLTLRPARAGEPRAPPSCQSVAPQAFARFAVALRRAKAARFLGKAGAFAALGPVVAGLGAAAFPGVAVFGRLKLTANFALLVAARLRTALPSAHRSLRLPGLARPAAGSARQNKRSKTFTDIVFPNWRPSWRAETTTLNFVGSMPCKRIISVLRNRRPRLVTQCPACRPHVMQGDTPGIHLAKRGVLSQSMITSSSAGSEPCRRRTLFASTTFLRALVCVTGGKAREATDRLGRSSKKHSIGGHGIGSGKVKVPRSTSRLMPTM